MKKVVPGDVVCIEFYDHAQVSGCVGEILRCKLFGKLLAETDVAYEVGSWMMEDEEVNHNDERYYIVKGAVILIRRFEEAA